MSEQIAILTHIIKPVERHTHTAIFLHGRGDTGPDFAVELLTARFTSTDNETSTLSARLPSWRWVFPSAPSRWSLAFQEEIPAWFEAASLLGSTAGEDLQMNGIIESVTEIAKVIDKEVSRLEGHPENLVLCGISQGAAVGMWTLLCSSRAHRRLGGFIGASSWLPAASEIEAYLAQAINYTQPAELTFENPGSRSTVNFVLKAVKTSLERHGARNHILSTPILLGHGTDDAWVDVSSGRKARDVLRIVGFTDVAWKEYAGAGQEGHWFKEPEQLDDIAEFLAAVEARQLFPIQ